MVENGKPSNDHVGVFAGTDDEAERLSVLQDLDLLDTPESESFDRITRMAARLFQVPISAVSLTDCHRQWFKSHVGTQGREIPREGAPCAEVTRSRRMLVIPDMLDDSQFCTSLLAKSGIRFYAGAPLITREGHVLGAMCVLDQQPRTPSPEEQSSLVDFAAMVMAQIELQHDFGRVDPLSGLPNRNQLTEDLTDLLRDHRGEDRVAVLIDLAEPRQLNQMLSVLGTVYIDDLVRASSSAIKETLGGKTGLYHIGNTSFAVLLNEKNGHTWEDVVSGLAARLKTPVICNGIPVPVNAVFGVSPFRLADSSPHEVVRTAVGAAHDAREAEIEYAVYSPASDEANHRRFALLTDIRRALSETDQLTLVYQPRVDVRTEVCVSAEALLRWKHPRFGNVSPGEFIPLVEQTALARPVTNFVIGAALDQLAAWRKSKLDVRISINISALNLEEPDFAANLAASLEQRKLSAQSIELEFTESALIRNHSRVISQLRDVRALGVELAIDDFGTGYSTFSYLQKLPAQTVKLDKSFIDKLGESKRDQTLVRSIVLMAQELGYRVVAEGVETADAYQFLADCGCDEIQGYFIARPLTVPAFESWIREGRDRQLWSALQLLQGS